MDFLLAFLSSSSTSVLTFFGMTALSVFFGIYVTFNPPNSRRAKGTWLVVFALLGVVAFVGALLLSKRISERQDEKLEAKLTGGSNYAYLVADPGDLKNRTAPVRAWVCATGNIFDLRIHPYPRSAADADDPAYSSILGNFQLTVLPGCMWAGIALPTGKLTVELLARNGLVLQQIEIATPPEGPFTQLCNATRNGLVLPTPHCADTDRPDRTAD